MSPHRADRALRRQARADLARLRQRAADRETHAILATVATRRFTPQIGA